MAEPKDIVLRVLREIQADIADFRKVSEERFAKLEAGQRSIRSVLTGEAPELEPHK